MGIDRKSNTFVHVCIECGDKQFLKYPTHWYRTKKGKNKCNLCSKKGGNAASFKIGFTPWNKKLKGYGKWPKWYPANDKNPSWKGGVTSDSLKIRNSEKYKLFRKSILERDCYTCQECEQVGGNLQVDHIKPFAYFPDLRFEESNTRTLCVSCHKKTDTYLSGSFKYAIHV